MQHTVMSLHAVVSRRHPSVNTVRAPQETPGMLACSVMCSLRFACYAKTFQQVHTNLAPYVDLTGTFIESLLMAGSL